MTCELVKYNAKLPMKKPSVFDHLNIDYYSATPKYLQLANAIVKAINEQKLKKDEMLPSIWLKEFAQ